MLEKIIQISREAGEIIRDGFGKNFSIEFKTNSSNLVTEIDKKSEEAIIDFIKKEFPGHNILAEESGAQKFDSEYTWVIDPLDGTTNFAHGFPVFAVSIGVVKNDEIICGVVYDVMMDQLFTGEKGGGAFCNDTKMKVSSNENLAHGFLVTGFPYNINENPDYAIEHFINFIRSSRAVRRLGSAAIDMCYVAKGVYDGFWEVALNPWDVCAAMLMVEEAGGKVTNFKGEGISIYSKQILASNGKIHPSMMEILSIR